MKKAAGPNGPTVKKTLWRNAEGLMKYILKHQKKRAVSDAPMAMFYVFRLFSSKRGMIQPRIHR